MTKECNVEVKINFDENKITVIDTMVEELFIYPETGKFKGIGLFRIDGDSGGFSRIELQDGQMYKRNYLRRDRGEYDLVSEEIFDQKEARDFIKSLVKEKIENWL